MNAFDTNKKLKIKTMPHNNFVILDTQTNLYCTGYNEDLPSCIWGNILNAVRWDTQALVDSAIAVWGDTGSRYIGSNPPKPPQ